MIDKSIFETSGNSIWNMPFYDHLVENFFKKMEVFDMQNDCDKFLDLYPKWISSSKLNKITGHDKLPHRFVSLGTTQGIDWWQYWCMANGYKLRMYRGEYPYVRDVLLEGEWTSERFVDDNPLQKGDALIISLPFSGTGTKHDSMEECLDECEKLGIPVFVDCAWFGTCYGIEADLDRECIKMIAFSTTKGLSCGNWRAGIVFSRINEGALAVQTEWKHGIHLNVAIANSLMETFSPDTMPKKFKDAQHAVCQHYGMQPTNTIHIGMAPDGPDWDSFARDRKYNRVNIRKAVKQYKNKGTFE